ncbi:MAG: glycosyltransferase family 2 protein [Ignavibacterium album]|jgi:cellulose synthase/poly-beta-1,6-N-acetylglucosamine synthase-like glycosyltransferase|nr:glycosyltransferase [Ignavibacterium album]MBI5662013.1 glycosyltransferase family 2 protein [Ignavibacterium album]
MNDLIKIMMMFNYIVLFYFLSLVTIYFTLNIISFFRILRYKNKIEFADLERIFKLKNYKPISVIVPAYNEGNNIVENVKSLLQLIYPQFQLVIVNDGSKDNTLQKLIDNFSLKQISFPDLYKIKSEKINAVYKSKEIRNLTVVDKVNGGKADAINAGINVAKYPLITVIDADSLLERDCLLKIAQPFIENENVVAVGGTIRIANGCEVRKGHIIKVGLSKNWLARFQVIEYLRAFLFGRTGFDALNGILIISGAFSCFKRDAVVEIGGYRSGSIGEDMEIVMRLHKHFRKINPDTKITFIPDPICWTEAPESLKILMRQRTRWQKGTIESLLLHKEMLFNLNYGLLGFIVIPYYLIYEFLGPVIEFSGYIFFLLSLLLGILSFEFTIAFLAAAMLYGILLSILSVILEELSFKKYPNVNHLLILFLTAVLENFGYRQLTTWWRFKGTIEFFLGQRSWGNMEKKGLSSK